MKHTIIILLCINCALSSQHTLTLEPFDGLTTEYTVADISEYSIVRLDSSEVRRIAELNKDDYTLSLAFADQNYAFSLFRQEIRSSNHKLTSGDASQESTNRVHERIRSRQHRGYVKNAPQEQALFTFTNTFMLGYWEASESKFFVEPLWRYDVDAPRDLYLIYNIDNIIPSDHVCDAAEGMVQVENNYDPGNLARTPGQCVEVEIAVAADFEFYTQTGMNVADVNNYLLGLLALMQLNYDGGPASNEFDDEIRFIVTETFIATSSATDPFSNDQNSLTALEGFRDWGNSGGFSNNYDVATLWTGISFLSSTRGTAYLGQVCLNDNYGLVTNFSQVPLLLATTWAHELGHNFNALHNDPASGDIMDAGSAGQFRSTWSLATRSAINAFYASAPCLPTCPASAPVAGVMPSSTSICPGTSVDFINDTRGAVTAYSWSFPGGIPSSSTEFSPTVMYNNPGNYMVTLVATNPNGSSQSQVNISVGLGNTLALLSEDFEQGFGEVTIINPDGDALEWEFDNLVRGNGGARALVANNFNNNAVGTEDIIRLPAYDMSADNSNLRLEFEYAYQSVSPTFNDRLEVRVTSQGMTDVVFVGEEDGSMNFATEPDGSLFFRPTRASEWCFEGPQCIDLDLSAYNGRDDVIISIVNISGFGNNMYIDNIKVTATCAVAVLPVEWLSFYAIPAKDFADLKWTVNQDEVHAGFYVERRLVDAQNSSFWEVLATINAVGQANENVGYEYRDYTVVEGNSYAYRLRQFDMAGAENLSEIRVVTFDDSRDHKQPKLLPNPARDNTLLLTSESAKAFDVVDVNGRKIQNGVILSSRTVISLSNLVPGVYFVRVFSIDGSMDVVRLLAR